MSKDSRPNTGNTLSHITRRQLIMTGGIGALGLVFAKPRVSTIYPKSAFANYVVANPTPTPSSPSPPGLEFLAGISFGGGGGGGGGGRFVPSNITVAANVYLSYEASGLLPPTIGSSLVLQSGSTGVFDFDSSNSSGFGSFVSRITNGIDENLHRGIRALFIDPSGTVSTELSTPNGTISQWAAAGISESNGLNKSPDLMGKTVSIIRLVLNTLEITVTHRLPSPGDSGGSRLSFTRAGVWEFWGHT